MTRQRSLLMALVAAPLACTVPTGLDDAEWTEPEPAIFQAGPYIMLGTPGQVFISLKADGMPAPSVEWWVAPAVAAGKDAALPASEVHRVDAMRVDDLWVSRLENLPVGPAINYRVKSARGDTPTRTFRAGAPTGSKFRFAVFGDTRNGHGVHRQLVEAVDREQIEFTVHTGDMVQQGGVKGEWLQFFQIERPLLWDTPIIPAVGNHDVSGRDYFRRYFLHRLWSRDGSHYYATDWGNLRLVVLDTGIECRQGCDQYAFAERALREGARRGQMMAIMLHYPPFSSGAHGSNLEVQRPVRALAKRHGVELVIAGHDHNYERTKPIDGTVYVVSGSAGAPIRPVRPRSFTAEARTEPHYVLVDVEEDRLILRAVNLQGDTFDTYVIEDNPPS
jgi:predicted phosphodiesterase